MGLGGSGAGLGIRIGGLGDGLGIRRDWGGRLEHGRRRPSVNTRSWLTVFAPGLPQSSPELQACTSSMQLLRTFELIKARSLPSSLSSSLLY